MLITSKPFIYPIGLKFLSEDLIRTVSTIFISCIGSLSRLLLAKNFDIKFFEFLPKMTGTNPPHDKPSPATYPPLRQTLPTTNPPYDKPSPATNPPLRQLQGKTLPNIVFLAYMKGNKQSVLSYIRIYHIRYHIFCTTSYKSVYMYVYCIMYTYHL